MEEREMTNDRLQYEKLKKQNRFLVFIRQLSENRTAMTGLFILLILILLAAFAPFICKYGYKDMDLMNKYASPSLEHLFGTDDLGRDIFSRILYGGRYSLSLGVLSVLFSLLIGSTLGSIAGYFGGWADNLIMRLMDIIQAIPGMLLTIAMSAVLGNGFSMTIIALSISRIPQFVRLLRAQFMAVGGQEYVEAANSMSVSRFRIIVRYILPNAWSPLIVSATMGVANTILVASSLSFIGLGIQPPLPEWGAMLSAGRDVIQNYPHVITIPGIFIAITVLSLNMFGDGLRDALDPKLKN